MSIYSLLYTFLLFFINSCLFFSIDFLVYISHFYPRSSCQNLKRSEFMCSIRFFLSIIPTRAFCPSVPMWSSSSLGLLITPIILRLLFTIFLGITFVLIVFFYYGSLPFSFIVQSFIFLECIFHISVLRKGKWDETYFEILCVQNYLDFTIVYDQ